MSATTTPAYDTDNIFAKILRGEIPSQKVYEDDTAVCFMDAMPQSKGHCLVVPKAPSRNILDADPGTLSKLMPLVQKVARAAMSAFDADGISIKQFNEDAGGQTVYHLHIHIIPRFSGTPAGRHADGMEDPEILKDHAAKLKAALSA
ncbi:MAG: HIT family protein [Pseudomonadota bacterium]